MLNPEEILKFEQDGYVAIRGAFSRKTAEECMDVIWEKLSEHGIERHDRSTWTQPVVRVFGATEPPLVKAGKSQVLIDAYNQLLGENIWDSGEAVSGSFPIRFPSDDDPHDAGWHIDGSFLGEDGYWVNIQSRGRGLLCLFLFTDVKEEDASTRILRGSHMDTANILKEFGEPGINFANVTAKFQQSTFEREIVKATGNAGDVFICHPFLVHAASWPHCGLQARAVAQAGIEIEGFKLMNNGQEMPVEKAILNSLGIAL